MLESSALLARRGRAGVIVAALAASWSAGASLEFVSADASVRVPSAGAWAAASGSSFTALAWVLPASIDGEACAIAEVEGLLRIWMERDGRISAEIMSDGPDRAAMAVTSTRPLEAGRWALVGVSFDASSGALGLWRCTEGDGADSVEVVDASFVPGNTASGVTIGGFGGAPAMAGVVGALALRTEALSGSDMAAVWATREFNALQTLSTLGGGGSMSGEAGCSWMIGHAMATEPADGLLEETPSEARASWPGSEATEWNTIVMDRTEVYLGFRDDVVRPTEVAGLVRHVSPYDTGSGEFLVRAVVPTTTLPAWSEVEGPAGEIRRLLSGPLGLVRVVTSANSRAVRSNDGTGQSPGNYAHGFIALLEPRIAGVINRPASTGTGPWFGLDCGHAAPFLSGQVDDIAQMDFSRFWTGSVKAGSIGPGRGLRLSEGASYILRAGPAGMMTADAPLELRAHVLRRPGAGRLRWTPSAAAEQGMEGFGVGAPEELDLSTTVWSRAMGAGDSYSGTQRTLTLAGDLTGVIEAGWAVFAGGGRISVVSEIDLLDGPVRTQLTLEHRFVSAPNAGATLEFGPWSYEAIGAEAPAVGAGDPAVWRGLRLDSVGPGRTVEVFSLSAWREGVDGFVIGTFGWGGNGYDTQQEETFSGSIPAVVRELAPDIWLQMFAQQASSTPSMSAIAALVRSGAPGVSLAWLGDMTHSVASEVWHWYILENAAIEGLPAVSLLRDPRIGTLANQFADGLRSDPNHISQRGNELLAGAWLEALGRVALVSTPAADLDGDGEVAFADLNLLLDRWGQTGPLNPADLDGDEQVGFADLNLLLGHYHQ